MPGGREKPGCSANVRSGKISTRERKKTAELCAKELRELRTGKRAAKVPGAPSDAAS